MKCVFCARQDRGGSACNPGCMFSEPYMKDSPKSYDPEWFVGKTGEEVREALADRHGMARWRVDEIIDVYSRVEK